jgi:Phosphotransferase enzyme family
MQHVPHHVADSVDELVAGAQTRTPLRHDDSKSGALFEAVTIDGARFVLKHMRRADDWIMRATGDLACRPILVWESGLLDGVPDCIDHAIVGAARTDGDGGALLMRDVSAELVPPGHEPLALTQHLRFLDHMARMHAVFWGWRDSVGLTPLPSRYLEFCPQVADVESEQATGAEIPRLIGEGWRAFPARAPRAAEVVLPLLADPGPLLRALEAMPQTLVHGDWKAGNLGVTADGRTLLLDWATPGAAPACSDLAWYLALNTRRLPQRKEDAIVAYQHALERHGVATHSWFGAQVALCLLGALVQFGWEKALGDDAELAWWERRAVAAAPLVGV